MCDDGGGSRATTMEAGSGVDDACTSLSDADSNRTGLAMEIQSGAALAGSESRADVALKDESAGTVVALRAKTRQMHKEMRIWLKAQDCDPAQMNPFWAYGGWCNSN